MTWIDHYREHYRPLLDYTTNAAKRGLKPGLYCRARGFDIMFEHLLGQTAPYHIIETGTMRKLTREELKTMIGFLASAGNETSRPVTRAIASTSVARPGSAAIRCSNAARSVWSISPIR